MNGTDDSPSTAQRCGRGEQTIRTRLWSSIKWNGGFYIANQGVAFITTLGLAKLLGSQNFGHFSVANGLVLSIAGVAQASAGSTATRYIAEWRDTEKARAARVVRLCRTLAILIGALGVVFSLNAAPDQSSPLDPLDVRHLTGLSIGAYVFLAALVAYQTAVLAGLGRYDLLAQSALRSAPITVFAAWIGAFTLGVAGIFIALAATTFVRWMVYRGHLRTQLAAHALLEPGNNASTEWRVILDYALPSGLISAALLPTMWMGLAYLSGTHGAAAAGAFQIALTLKTLVLVFPGVVNAVVITHVNYHRGRGETSTAQFIFAHNLRIVGIAVFVMSGLLAALGSFVLRMIGADYASAYPVLLILLIAAVAEGMTVAMYQLVLAHRQMWRSMMMVNLPWAVTFVAATYALVPNLGAAGLAAAHCMGWIIASVGCWLQVRRLPA